MLHYLNGTRIALAILIVIASTSLVIADGKVFSLDAVQTPVSVPDQQALISYADGVETLVIETRFIGQGEQFAWVVPLPALPEVSAVSPSIFPTLRSLFRPNVIDKVESLWGLAIVLTVFCSIFLAGSYRRALLVALLCLLLFFIFVPTLAMSRELGISGKDAFSAVTVHSRKLIGDYEVATLSTAKPDALIDWLKQNHFAFDDRDKAVIADYVKEKWFFVAVKLSRKASTKDSASPHPLAFKFPTKQPIYPLRLTATHGGPCNIDLYVFGPGRASSDVPAFKTVQCGKTERPGSMADFDRWRKQDAANIAIVHSKLQPLVPVNAIATKLSGTLSSADMVRDAAISWEPFQVLQPTFYTAAAVRTIVLNAAVIILCFASLVLLTILRFGKMQPRRAAVIWLVVLVMVSPAAYAGYAMWPKSDIRNPQKAVVANNVVQGHVIPRYLVFAPGVDRDKMRNLALVKQRFDQLVRDPQSATSDYYKDLPAKPAYFKNNFTGEPRREEDTPGNYGFRQGKQGVEYLWYDDEGGEHSVDLYELAQAYSDAHTTAPATDPSGQ